MFDEEFVKQLPQDILVAQKIICDKFFEFRSDREDDIHFHLQAMAFAQVIVKVYSLGKSLYEPDIEDEDTYIISRVEDFFNVWQEEAYERLAIKEQKATFEISKDKFASMFGKGVFYEFSDDDFGRVQTLLNNLRELLTNSEDFEEDYRRRLLKKLEALQAELHKKMSDFDKFWGFFIDSGIALMKFWENAKPFRDDVKEICEIVSRTQARAENVQKFLPFKLLKGGDGGSEVEEANDKEK